MSYSGWRFPQRCLAHFVGTQLRHDLVVRSDTDNNYSRSSLIVPNYCIRNHTSFRYCPNHGREGWSLQRLLQLPPEEKGRKFVRRRVAYAAPHRIPRSNDGLSLQCDLVRPFCGQCARAKTQCGGYDDSLNMVLYSPMVSSPCLQTSLENRALEMHYVGVFWELFLPATPEGSQASGRDWTRTIRDHYTPSRLVKDAMLALTLSRIGKHTKNHNVASSGRTHYNSCLRQITQTINRQKGVPGDDVIAACLVLGLYEQMCSPALQGNNWQSHMQGIGTLMQLRGPHAFASGSGHHLFVGARLNLVSFRRSLIIVPFD